jgi:hypothetical protein
VTASAGKINPKATAADHLSTTGASTQGRKGNMTTVNDLARAERNLKNARGVLRHLDSATEADITLYGTGGFKNQDMLPDVPIVKDREAVAVIVAHYRTRMTEIVEESEAKLRAAGVDIDPELGEPAPVAEAAE